jgi:hypothetical protein
MLEQSSLIMVQGLQSAYPSRGRTLFRANGQYLSMIPVLRHSFCNTGYDLDLPAAALNEV